MRPALPFTLLASLSAVFPALADPDSEQAVRERAALVDFAIEPERYRDEPALVRCPMFGADLAGFSCAAYNASGENVGVVRFSAGELPADDRRRALNSCVSRTVSESCVARITATVDEWGTPLATGIEWPPR